MFPHLDLWILGGLGIWQPQVCVLLRSWRTDVPVEGQVWLSHPLQSPSPQISLPCWDGGDQVWGLGKKWAAHSSGPLWQGTVDARWIKTSFEPSVFTAYWEKSFFIETKCSPTLLTCCLCLLKQPRFDPWLEVSSAPGSMAFFCPMSLSSCDECSQGF